MARRAGKWLLTLSLAAMLPPVIEHGALPGFGGLLGLNRTAEASYQTTTAPSRIVTALTTGLQAAEPAARATAACELGLRGSDAISAVPALVSLLADDARVDDLECGDNRGNGDRWMSGGELRHCSTSPARESAQALSRIGTDAIKPLIAALSDMRATMRRYAAIALGMVDDRSVLKPAVAHLVTTLHDSDWQVRRSAVWALGEVRDAQLVTPIAASLKDEHPRVREMAAHGLGELRIPGPCRLWSARWTTPSGRCAVKRRTASVNCTRRRPSTSSNGTWTTSIRRCDRCRPGRWERSRIGARPLDCGTR